MPGEELAASVSALTPRDRAEFLELCERGPEIVPLLAEAVFTSAVLATGVEHAAWLVEHATQEQRVAALDLDCWQDQRPIPERFFEWIDAMIEAGPETLVRAFDELDLELWILLLRRMASFRFLSPTEWADVATLDGLVGIDAQTSEGEERVRQILGTALTDSPEHYWRFVGGVMNESPLQCQEAAARNQRARLEELGFPERGQAMGVYRPLPLDDVSLPPPAAASPTDDALMVRGRPPAGLEGTVLGEALVGLGPDTAARVFADVLVVANSLAVADQLPLAEPDSVTRSLEKAVRGIERGLVALAEVRGRSPSSLLAGLSPTTLFRAGASVDRSLRPTKSKAELRRDEEADDWSVATESIAEADQTLADDGDSIEYGGSTLPTGRVR